MLKSGGCNPTSREELENEKADYDLRAVGRPGAAGARLPVRRRDKASPTARGYDGADAAAVAGRVLAVHRRGRGARRDRPDPPRAPGIRPGLTPLAASGLVIIMTGATALTVAGGAVGSALIPLVVGLLSVFVAYGRGRLGAHRGDFGEHDADAGHAHISTGY